MGRYDKSYKCGLFVKEQREANGFTREQLAGLLFPFSKQICQYNSLSQIETDHRGLTLEQARTIDQYSVNGQLEAMIQDGQFEIFKRGEK